MKCKLFNPLIISTFACFMGMFSPMLALHAHARGGSVLEEVIVTAQKREGSLQNTPISLMAYDEHALERLGISNINDIAHTVPNLDIRQTTNGSAGARIYIRGVGVNDHVVTLDGAVGVYMDGVYIARNTGLVFEVADLERIEVLRGPQGSLWGRNTSGGAIDLISKKPSGEFRFKQVLDFGNFGYTRANTQIDLPRIGDFSIKLSALYGQNDGWVDNRGLGVNFGEAESKGARFAARWTPSDRVTIDYSYDYSESEYGSAYYQPTSPFNAAFPNVPYSSSRWDKVSPGKRYQASDYMIRGHGLTLQWDINDHVTLKSITAYRDMRQGNYTDNGANPVSSRLYANDPYNVRQDQFSEELQLIGNALGESLHYTLGLYYFEEQASEYGADYISLFYPPAASVIELKVNDRDLTAKNTAWAAFGSFTWTPPADILNNRLHLTAGFRLSMDRREIDMMTFGSNGFAAEAEHKWRNLSPSFTLAYDLGRDSSAYFKYANGYRTGGYNGRATTYRQATVPVDEENLVSLELGLKSEWFDRRLRFNAALFHSDYDDIQLALLDPSAPGAVLNVNAGEAEMKGIEAELAAVLSEGLILRASYAYLDREFVEVIDPVTQLDITDDFLLVGAPKRSYNLDLEYRFRPFKWGQLAADLNYSWKDQRETASRVSDNGIPLDSFGILNARLLLQDIPISNRSQLSVALWVKNLTDKEYAMDGFRLSTAGAMLVTFGEPRTFGLELTYNFE